MAKYVHNFAPIVCESCWQENDELLIDDGNAVCPRCYEENHPTLF